MLRFPNGSVKQDPDELSLLSIKELIPGLQPLAFWMSNSIELLHFIQQEVPKLLLWGEEGGEIEGKLFKTGDIDNTEQGMRLSVTYENKAGYFP